MAAAQSDVIATTRARAQAGEAWAQDKMGKIYWNGYGVPQDFPQAAEWFRRAAEQGDAYGLYMLSVSYDGRPGMPTDIAQSVRWGQAALENGYCEAASNLGYYFREGKDFRHNYVESARYYRIATACDERFFGPNPMDEMVKNNMISPDMRVVRASDFQVIRRAAEAGKPWGQAEVGAAYCSGRDWGIPKDPAQCVAWWRKAAEQGLPRAEFVVGQFYWEGKTVPRDPGEAVKWLRRAADHGDDDAMALLGNAYETGDGVPQDYAQARHWYLETGSYYKYAYVAWFGLGRMEEEGKGGPVDLYAAKSWYTKAAEGSWTDEGKQAKQRLDSLEANLKAAALKSKAESGDAAAQFDYAESLRWRDPKIAADWYRKSATQGNVAAMKALAKMYEDGVGVDKDYQQAATWYKRAADKGDDDAKHKLADMIVDGKITALPGANAPAKPAEPQVQQGPLTITQVEELLKGSVRPVRVRAIVKERGVDFALNSDAEKRLRAAGADDALIIAVAENKR